MIYVSAYIWKWDIRSNVGKFQEAEVLKDAMSWKLATDTGSLFHVILEP